MFMGVNLVLFPVVFRGILGSVVRSISPEVAVAVTEEHRAHAQAHRLPIAIVASYLQETLGQRLTAVIAEVSDAKAVGKWAKGQRTPQPDMERRLRDAFQITQLLVRTESSETVRAWFTGMNPDLGDRAPALVIAEDPVRVLHAARAFLANG